MPTFSIDYALHGIHLRLTTDSRFIRDAIDTLLGCFSSPGISAKPDIFFFLFQDRGDPSCSIPHDTELIFANSPKNRFDLADFGLGAFEVYRSRDTSTHFLTLKDYGTIFYRLDKGEAFGRLKNLERMNPHVFSSFIFVVVLSELLKTQGYFPIHCSAVEKSGRGVLIPGFSGAGKTTACIALIRQGFGFLGDDRPILHYRDDGSLEILSFPESIDVTGDTIGLFPELRNMSRFDDDANLRKKSFHAGAVYPGSVRRACTPAVILFPRISNSRESRLTQIPRDEALADFLPHGLIVLDKGAAEKNFDIIHDLILASRCYRLEFGTDMDTIGPLVESVL